MNKTICLLLFTSMAIADIPSAGRPNPGAFTDETMPVLDQIDKHILEMNANVAKIEVVQKELEHIRMKIDYLMWLLDHSIYEERPPFKQESH